MLTTLRFRWWTLKKQGNLTLSEAVEMMGIEDIIRDNSAIHLGRE